jgi:hypothetical protein
VDAQFFDRAEDVRSGNIVEGMFVFPFEAPAKIFGADVAGFAVG